VHRDHRRDHAVTATPSSTGTVTTAAGKPLVVRVRNWVGDVVNGLPALKLLEEHGYALHIVARGGWAVPLLSGHGWPVLVQPKDLRGRVKQLKALRASLRAADPTFDRRENAVVFATSLSSALELRLAGLRAVGYANEGRSPLLARTETIVRGGHALISFWNLSRRFLRIERDPPRLIGLEIPPAKIEQATRTLAEHGIHSNSFMLVCPFAGGPATSRKLDKKWPGFAAFVPAAMQRFGLPVVICPGPGEHESAQQLYPHAVRIGNVDLMEYAALLRAARLVVSNDTGPAHIAAAVGAPLLSVLAPTIPEQWAPWGPQVHVIRKPQPDEGCAWPEVDEVLDLARAMLEGKVAESPLPAR
jgi:heptosyltransferase-2